MGKVYDTQTMCKFYLNTGVDITGATQRKIKWKKPDGTLGDWTASEEGDPLDGVISYEIVAAPGQFNEWIFWAWIEFSAGKNAPGESARLHIYEEGT